MEISARIPELKEGKEVLVEFYNTNRNKKKKHSSINLKDVQDIYPRESNLF